MKKILSFSIWFLSLFCHKVKAQWSVLSTDKRVETPWYLYQPFTPKQWNASNFATEKDMNWFEDARYGMFIHFGLSTYKNAELSWGTVYTRKLPDSGHGAYPDSVWTKWPQYFKFEKFNAKQWVKIAQRAGMKYIVVIAKHHEGFHMWDTKYSDFKVTNTPFGRDFLKELSDACHQAGMKFGIYYSQRDWYEPDYDPVDTANVVLTDTPPYWKLKPGHTEPMGERHRKYIDYQFNVVRELCTHYGKVDIFWFDAAWWGGMFTPDMWQSEKLTRMIRKLQPGIIINNRASIPGDFDTPEQRVGMYQQRPWESCATLTSTWSYSPTPAKSKKQLIQMLIGTATGNGNLLLSWGPEWNGAFDKQQTERLYEVGDWLKKYGETIYGTRGGPWIPGSWGGSTRKGNKIYLHITKWTSDTIRLPMFAHNHILSAKCLTGGNVQYAVKAGNLNIYLPPSQRDSISTIVELTTDTPVTETISKPSNSIFSNNGYGNVLMKKAPYADKNISTTDNSFIIDCKKTTIVKGISITNISVSAKTEPAINIYFSNDGKDWQLVQKVSIDKNIIEIPITQFSAGAQVPVWIQGL